METTRDVAKRRGGRCVTASYTTTSASIKWECALGHRWYATVNNVVRHGTWCPICARQAKRLTIERLRSIAKERGGECLDWDRTGAHGAASWCCCRGHVWSAEARSVIQGSWCPTCTNPNEPIGRPLKYTIEDMRVFAIDHDGECLSTVYEGTVTPLLWRCANGHEWYSKPKNVIGGSWCPYCSYSKPRTAKKTPGIEKARAIAADRGGSCLSSEYTNSHASLAWRCSHGHEFHLSLVKVSKGRWCTECELGRPKVTRMTIDQEERYSFLEEAAWLLGGELLSPAYTDDYVPLRWRCERGHEFSATPAQVEDGIWCPVCDPDPWEPSRSPENIDSKSFSTTITLPARYKTDGRPARGIVLVQVDPDDDAIAASLVTKIAALESRGEIRQLAFRSRLAIKEFADGQRLAKSALGRIYSLLNTTFLDIRTPGGAVIGWIAMEQYGNAAGVTVLVDFVLDPPHRMYSIVVPLWMKCSKLAGYIMYDGRDSLPRASRIVVRQNTPFIIQRLIEQGVEDAKERAQRRLERREGGA
nr:hypothetical protein [Candidatus Sigynarchaeota archaeon]